MCPDETRSSRKPRCPRPPRGESVDPTHHEPATPTTVVPRPEPWNGTSQATQASWFQRAAETRAEKDFLQLRTHRPRSQAAGAIAVVCSPPEHALERAKGENNGTVRQGHPARRLATGSTLAGQVGRLGNIANAISGSHSPPPLLRSSSAPPPPPLLLRLLRSSAPPRDGKCSSPPSMRARPVMRALHYMPLMRACRRWWPSCGPGTERWPWSSSSWVGAW